MKRLGWADVWLSVVVIFVWGFVMWQLGARPLNSLSFILAILVTIAPVICVRSVVRTYRMRGETHRRSKK